MNKTVNINLGGFFFHIDENAYQKLNRYFEAIKKSLDAAGRDEIMNDIESRISELFSEKLTSEKQVIGLIEVDQVIAVMGQPEDYNIDDNVNQIPNSNYTSDTKSKKLYRDTENGILGGVSSGLGHYFGIDSVWIRIILVLLVFAGFGTGIIAYIVLWVVMPEAKTTAEKLEMRGEPINISNIEKKVKEEFGNFSDKIKNADYDKMGNQVKSSAEKIGSALGDILPKIFVAFGKVLGAIIVFIAASTLFSLIISFFAVGTFPFFNMPWQRYVEAVNYSAMPFWFLILLSILAIGIPFFFLLILGLKLLISNLRSIGNTAKYILLALWIISVAVLIVFGIKQATAVAYEGKVANRKEIIIKPNDTLKIKFQYNDLFAKSIDDSEDFEFVQDATNKELIYSNDVQFYIMPTDQKTAYVLVENIANGNTLNDAKKRAEKINYNFKLVGNEIIFDNYLLTEAKNKFRDQEVKIYLYLPEGTLFKTDSSVQEYDNSDNDYFNLHYSSSDYVYKVEASKVKCLDCPDDENEYNDIRNNELENELEEIVPGNVTINKNGISITNDTIKSDSRNIKELKINKDGIIIKTN